MKQKRKPAGWREADRHCALCNKEIPPDKYLNRHHLSYDPEIIVSLHYTCHNVVHGRVKYHHPYDRQYGKDFGPYFTARSVMNLYRRVEHLISNKYPDEFRRIK